MPHFLRCLLPIVLGTSPAFASPLCDDLARFACAPGTFEDGTGQIKSEEEVSAFMTGYAEKSRKNLNERFAKILDDPENEYFKDLAMAGLGLKNAPQCTSSDPADQKGCRQNLITGLTTIAQKQALGRLMPRTLMERTGNLEDMQYIINNNTYQKVIEDLNKQVSKDLATPELSQRIETNIFPKVKNLIIERLKKLDMPEDKRRLMINKVKSIGFEGTTCEELASNRGMANNNDLVSSLLVPNAFYDRGRNIFKHCSGFTLQSTSEFQIVHTIAHELGHAIDPCGVATGPADMGFKYSKPGNLESMESEYPVKNIISCLRGDKSVGAKNFNDPREKPEGASPMPDCAYCGSPTPSPYPYPYPMPGAGWFPNTQYGGYGMPVANTKREPDFCTQDQITEAVPDWLAAEVLPEYMAQNHPKLTQTQFQTGYANAFKLGCAITGVKSSGGEHPLSDARINRMILTHPKIRQQMGCPPKHKEFLYCDPEKPSPKKKTGDDWDMEPEWPKAVK